MYHLTRFNGRARLPITHLLTLLVLLAGLLPLQGRAAATPRATAGAEEWTPGFHFDGFYASNDLRIEALVEDDAGHLYVAGRFSNVGTIAANNIAMWDGSAWHALGSGTNNRVNALALAPDGTLYAGGWFTQAGGVAASYIARWNGTGWQALGSGTNSFVLALVAAADGTLYVGGTFKNAGGSLKNYIASWDGTSWGWLGSGMNGHVSALGLDAAGRLYAGGGFSSAGGVGVAHLARWDGSAWSDIGGAGGYEGGVNALALAPDDTLYVGGYFTDATGVSARNVAKWDGSAWHNLGEGLGSGESEWVDALAVGPDGTLYAGGPFSEGTISRIARWDGAAWQPLGDGLSQHTKGLLVRGDGLLYALKGAALHTWGPLAPGSDERGWSVLQPVGEAGAGVSGTVYDLLVAPDGDLYAAGAFSMAGTTQVNYVARWDGADWHALGSGTSGPVHALALAPDGTLYAGGEFTSAGGVPAHRVAKWDGASWSALGSGMNRTVRALAVAPDGTLYAGGEFTNLGFPLGHHVARWDGSAWQPLGTGTNDDVEDLATDSQGRLYVAGDFYQAGGQSYSHLAIWDGAGWSAFSDYPMNGSSVLLVGPDDTVYAATGWALQMRKGGSTQAFGFDQGMIGDLALGVDGTLYAAGLFSLPGSTTSGIARWDGAQWRPFATSLPTDQSSSIFGLASTSQGELYVGGLFLRAGSSAAAHIARWGLFPVSGPSVVSASTIVVGKPTRLAAVTTGGNPIFYSWSFGDRSAGAAGIGVTHTYQAVGSYTVTLTATNALASEVATKTVVVKNNPPIASAGADRTIVAGSSVQLAGASWDPDGHTPLSYYWRQTAGTPVKLSSPSDMYPTFTAPAERTVLSFTLMVTDSYGLAATKPHRISLTVQPQANLAVALSAHQVAQVDQPFLYALTLTNSGVSTATGVTATLELAGEVTVVTLPTGCALSGPVVSCARGPLAPAASATIKILVRATTTGTARASAHVGALEPDPLPGNNTAGPLAVVIRYGTWLPTVSAD